jgi:alanyl-tRNA synthetase
MKQVQTLKDIRNCFLDFFQDNEHEVLPSSSLIPQNDPSLMFVNAGMVQFKNIFTGTERANYKRATTSQKCVRAGGKHNDLENVGYTARHHTFFEMLGNFSFGDYFKETAIELAWKFLTCSLGLPKDKLYVTVYHEDEEARKLWRKISQLNDDKIISIDTDDNFWSMGDTGPCGPCSEIYYDHGPALSGGLPGSGIEGDRFVEIWNLVFMQYEKLADGRQVSLPSKSIDTGMGLERITTVIQGVHNNYDIDIFYNIISACEDLLRKKATPDDLFSYRVIADHLRSACFLIADGVMPSNEGRGYVLRRIMRRGMLHSYQLGSRSPLLSELVEQLCYQMGEQYNELKHHQALITSILKIEEERFLGNLERGIKLLHEYIERRSSSTLPGEIAFKLYDTYGFPLDLTSDMLKKYNIAIEMKGFDQEMQKQKELARASWIGSGEKKENAYWFDIKNNFGACEFVGYDSDKSAARINAMIYGGKIVKEITTNDLDKDLWIVTNQTPFYGESGGQVGDTGHMKLADGQTFRIKDTKKYLDDVIAHLVDTSSTDTTLRVNSDIVLQIDTDKRTQIRANHSATHLLHHALRKILGKHVAQKGSMVDADRIRLDVSHAGPIAEEVLEEVEREVNKMIIANYSVNTMVMGKEEALNYGAIALFGEKYKDEVRVVSMGNDDMSVEFCGGTHVTKTGDIGLFKIEKESGIAAGIRRIEALTSLKALDYVNNMCKTQKQIAMLLKSKETELIGKLETILSDYKYQQKKLHDLQMTNIAKELSVTNMEKRDLPGLKFLSKIVYDIDPKDLRNYVANMVEEGVEDIVIAVFVIYQKAVSLIVTSNSKDAALILKAAITEMGGNGGGNKSLAQAGGGNVEKINAAIEAIAKICV